MSTRFSSLSRPSAICRSRMSHSAAVRALRSTAVSRLLVTTDTTRRNGQSSRVEPQQIEQRPHDAGRRERQAGFERIGDAELVEHVADARRGLAQIAKHDDDVARPRLAGASCARRRAAV